MGYDFEVVYHSGKENKATNELPHILENSNNVLNLLGAQLMALSSLIST